MYNFFLKALLSTSLILCNAAVAESPTIPSFENIYFKHTQMRDLNNFLGALHTGRFEAIRQAKQTIVCPSENGEYCDDGLNWDSGWIMFIDKNEDLLRDSGEKIFWTSGSMDEGFSMIGSETLKSNFGFSAQGYALTNGHFTLCDPRGPEYARAILINSTERPRASFTDSNGNTLTCP